MDFIIPPFTTHTHTHTPHINTLPTLYIYLYIKTGYLKISSGIDISKKSKTSKKSSKTENAEEGGLSEELKQFWKQLESNKGEGDDNDNDEEDNVDDLMDGEEYESDDDSVVLGEEGTVDTSNIGGRRAAAGDDHHHDDDDDEEMDEAALERLLAEEDAADEEAGLNVDDEEEDAAAAGEADDDEEKKQKKKKQVIVTKQRANAWLSLIKNTQSVSTLKKLLLAFFVAVHEDTEQQLTKAQQEMLANIPYRFKDQKNYLRVMVGTFKYSVDVFDSYCEQDYEGHDDEEGAASQAGGDDDADEVKLKKRRLPILGGRGYTTVAKCIKHYLMSLLHLFRTSSGNVTLLTYALKFLPRVLPYFVHHKTLIRKLLRCMLNLLGHAEELIRYRALLIIREMCTLYPYPFIDLCLKGVYFTLVQNSMQYSAHKFTIVEFLKNCVVELYGLDMNHSYHHAFIYIRELAITLRRALEPKQFNYMLVYNWRFMNCVDTWCKVVCAQRVSGAGSDMDELVYPLVQILLGVCQVQHNAKFIVAKFKALSMLNFLARNTQRFIPVAPLLTEVFDLSEFKKPMHKRASEPLDVDFALRVPKKAMDTKEFQDYLHDETIYLITEYLHTHGHAVSLPELAFPLTRFIKQCIKQKKLPFQSVKKFQTLVHKVQESSQLILKKRISIDFSVAELANPKGKRAQPFTKFIPETQKTPLDQAYERSTTLRAEDLFKRVSLKLNPEDEEDAEEVEDEEAYMSDGNDDTPQRLTKYFGPTAPEEADEEEEEDSRSSKIRSRQQFDAENDEEEEQEQEEEAEEEEEEQPAPKKQKLSKQQLKKLKKKANQQKDKVKTLSLDDL